MTPPRRSFETLWFLLLLSACLLHSLFGYSDTFQAGNAWGADDAYISYRYASNLLEGHGLVFNPGERVEGYTNLLYVLLVSPAFLFLDNSMIYSFSVALNILLTAVAFWVFRRIVAERVGRSGAAVAACLFAFCPSIWVSVASGMETPLVTALQMGIWWAIERVADGEARRTPLLAALLVLSVLARADGFVVAGIALVYLAIRSRPKEAAWCAVAVAATVSAHVAWRYAYYGYPLPNTYYAKVAGPISARAVNGLLQFGGVFLHQGLVVYPLAFVFGLYALVRQVMRSRSGALGFLRFDTVFSVCWLIYWLYIGGDHIGDRFLISLTIFWIATFVRVIVGVLDRRAVIFFVLLILLVQVGALSEDRRFAYSPKKYDCWITLGNFLAERHPEATLAIDGAGKVPFFTGFRAVDMLGLNDEYIAHLPMAKFEAVGHDRFDPDYILSRQPDLIGAWIVSEQLDMHWGLTREKYDKAGYELKYLVQTTGPTQAAPIQDITGMDKPGILLLRRRGYQYGMLLRRSASASLEALPAIH